MNNTQKRVDRWKAELKALTVLSWRWGETRRFQSNRRKIERRDWLIRRIADAEAGRRTADGGRAGP